VIVALGLLALTAGLAYSTYESYAGGWGYPLDDTYIHLSLARQLADTGQWGLGNEEAAFCASSPGYVLLLALGHRLGSQGLWLPLALNLLAGLGLAWTLAQCGFSRAGPWGAALLLLPWPLLVLSGMEHTLHSWACLALLVHYDRAWQGKPRRPWRWMPLLWAAVSLRYETLFLLGPMVLGWAWRGQYRQALSWLLLGLLPVLALGAWSASQGGTWLPLSLWAKGHSPWTAPGTWLMGAVQRLYDNPFMLTLPLALLWTWPPQESSPWRAVVLAAMGLHLLLADVGGYRYEAYLVALAGAGIGRGIDRTQVRGRPDGRTCGIAWLLLFPLLLRSGFFLWHYPQAIRNVQQQPYQVGRFLAAHYQGQAVALNDIGLATYLGQVQPLDLVGLGDQAVWRLRRAGHYDPAAVDSLALARGARLAVVHPNWIGLEIPVHWCAVASWSIPDNFILAGPTVVFYAVRPGEVSKLKAALDAYRARLSGAVQVRWLSNAQKISWPSSLDLSPHLCVRKPSPGPPGSDFLP